MNDETKFTVAKMPHAYVTPDGEKVALTYENEDGEKVRLVFSGEQYEKYSTKAIQLFTRARNQRLAKGGHSAIHAVAAEATMASAAIGGGRVLLSVRADNEVPYHFAISPEKALGLRRQLLSAAKSAIKQASEPRH